MMQIEKMKLASFSLLIVVLTFCLVLQCFSVYKLVLVLHLACVIDSRLNPSFKHAINFAKVRFAVCSL